MNYEKRSDESIDFSFAPHQLYEDIEHLLGDEEGQEVVGLETDYSLSRGYDGELIVHFDSYDQQSGFLVNKTLVVQSDGVYTTCGLQYTNFSASDYREEYDSQRIMADRDFQGKYGITRVSHDELENIWQDMLHGQRKELFELAEFAYEFMAEPTLLKGEKHMYKIMKTEDGSFCFHFTELNLDNMQTDWILEVSGDGGDYAYKTVLYRERSEDDESDDPFISYLVHLDGINRFKHEITAGILSGQG